MKTNANSDAGPGGNDACLVGAQSCCAQDRVIAPEAQQVCAPTSEIGLSQPSRSGGAGLWLGVALVFGLLLGAYAVFFAVASRHPVAEVPLVTAPARR
jgi:hypothetical protein